jgi:hypothetical protein
MPVGDKSKNNYLLKGLGQYADRYGVDFLPKGSHNPYSRSSLGGASDQIHEMNSWISKAVAVPGGAKTALDFVAKSTLIPTEGLASLSRTIAPISEFTSAVGTGMNVLGGVTSGISLAQDIKDLHGEKPTFDQAMNIADHATNIVSSAVSMIPVVGTVGSIALSVGEKLATGAIKAAHSVAEEKKETGQKHLDPGRWGQIVLESYTPKWMSKDWGEAYRDWKPRRNERRGRRRRTKI